MCYLPRSLQLLLFTFPGSWQQLHLFPLQLPHLFPVVSAPEWCEDYNSQSALLLPLEQGRLGMLCPVASLSIGKGRESGRGPLSRPKPPAAREVPSGLVPCHSQTVQPSNGPGGWVRMKGAASWDACVLETPGDRDEQGSR